MSLLAQRGSLRRRSRSGFLQQVGAVLRTVVVGRKDNKASMRPAAASAGLGIVAAAVGCIGVGYLLGNTFPWAHAKSDGGLSASVQNQPRNGVAPGPIGEQEDMKPLASRFFLTAAYPQLADGAAAARALRQAGLATARLRELPLEDKVYYGLVVYFDGDRDRDTTRAALGTVTAPDDSFERYRKTQKGWPLEQQVR